MTALGSTISRSTEAASRKTRLERSGPILPPLSRSAWQAEQFASWLRKTASPRFHRRRPTRGPAGSGQLAATAEAAPREASANRAATAGAVDSDRVDKKLRN